MRYQALPATRRGVSKAIRVLPQRDPCRVCRAEFCSATSATARRRMEVLPGIAIGLVGLMGWDGNPTAEFSTTVLLQNQTAEFIVSA